jgi:hypothetical protein
VDVVALSILSGAHMTLFPEVMKLMRARGIGDRLLTGGGIIPSEDMGTLAGLGVGRLFGPGASTQDIAHYIREWFAATHRGDGAAPRGKPRVVAGAKQKAAAAKPVRKRAPRASRASQKPAAKPKRAPRARRKRG